MNMTRHADISTVQKLNLAHQAGLDKMQLLHMLKNIYLSRYLDDAEIRMKKQSKAFFQISGAGHEGILTAAGMVLKPAYDWFLCYYRDRAICTALGVTAYEMLCQANGNIGDTASHGRQMPAHWGNVKLNIFNKSSCTGTQFLQACGLAQAGKILELADRDNFKKDEIVFVSTGDGTTSQGEFWEGLTTAVVNKLPVLFLVEDNGYAISVPVSVQTPAGSISKALENFPGLKIFEVDGTCPILSFVVMKQAEQYIRSGKGPALVHAHVTRPYSHSMSDDHSMYRTKDELDSEKIKDVVNSFPKFLIDAGVISSEENEVLQEEVKRYIQHSIEECLKTPWPKQSTVMDHLYSMEVDPTSSKFETKAKPTSDEAVAMASAINMTLKSELKKNSSMIMFGEDVADFSEDEKLETDLKGKGGVFKVTAGCQRNSKPWQVFNSPLAEANIIGRSIGMAARGLKPVVEIQFFDYIWTAYMQLKNEMATLRYRSGGDYSCPMVIRVPIGGYLKGGAMYHSQSGESLFTHCPGIRVVYPSNAQDAVGLLRTAIRCDDPVLFLEHKHLYYQGYNRTPYPGDEYMIPFGKAKVVQPGSDITIICWGALVQKSIDAAKTMEKEGVSVEVIDARTIAPFDIDTVIESVKKTNRLLIAHEEHKTSGFAGEICALVNERGFEYLDAPIKRVASMDTHVAYCPDLEEVILPQTNHVVEALRELANY